MWTAIIYAFLQVILLSLSDIHADTVEMPFAKDCNKVPKKSIWFCNIASSNQDIYQTNVSLVEHSSPSRITIKPLFSKQILDSDTVASPGPGRGAWSWSSHGLPELLTNKPSSRSIENIEDLYTIEKQKVSLKSQCGDVDLPWFGENKKEAFFVRGHYAPNADYKTDVYKRATFHYFNAAPQWQRFNNGNWKNKVEDSIQTLVKESSASYDIYSGSYGQLTCPNDASKAIYIKNDISKPAKIQVEIPIPKLFYKVITPHVLQLPKKPIFIATTNHPTMNKGKIEKYLREHFCDPAHDICDKIPDRSNVEYNWFKPSGFLCEKSGSSFSTIEAGYTYACEATPEILSKLGVVIKYKASAQGRIPSRTKVRIGSQEFNTMHDWF